VLCATAQVLKRNIYSSLKIYIKSSNNSAIGMTVKRETIRERMCMWLGKIEQDGHTGHAKVV